MAKISILSAGFLAASLSLTSTSHAQGQKTFPVKIAGMETRADCSLLENGRKTSGFLGTLDSGFHAAAGTNLYEMTARERQPYLEKALKANPTINPSYLKAVFERPYREYERLSSEKEKVRYLEQKLAQHGLREPHLDSIIEACRN